MNLAGSKDPAELSFQKRAALLCEDVKNVLAEDFSAG